MIRTQINTTQDVYEIIVDGRYYGTIKVPGGANRITIKERIRKMFPKLEDKIPNKDYEVNFCQNITPSYRLGTYSRDSDY